MLVVADETLDTCPGPRGSGCLQPGDFVLYFKRHPEWGRNAESTFWAQIRVQPVPGSLRNERVDVIFMPAAPAGEAPAPLSDLVRALAPYPDGSVAVQLSSPIYPSHGTAVMSFVSNDGGGVLFLVRENRDWRIVASEGWTY